MLEGEGEALLAALAVGAAGLVAVGTAAGVAVGEAAAQQSNQHLINLEYA